ncbi:MAG: hypothetical protein P8X74_20195 [Reinekea sp.]
MNNLILMKPSPEDRLSNEVYDDLFIEVSWLYEQRQGIFKDPTYQWIDLQSFESRLMFFLDALILRNHTVDAYCQEHAFDGDTGNVFTAVYVLAKRNGLSAIQPLINEIDFDDPAFRNAFIDAVTLALSHDDKKTLVTQFFADNTPAKLEIAAKLSGDNRFNQIDLLLQTLKQAIESDNPTDYESLLQSALTALGQQLPLSVPAKQDFTCLYALIEQGHSDATLYCLSIAMLKARQDDIIRQGVAHMEQQAWPILPLAVHGKVGIKHFYAPLLTNKHSSPEQINDLLLALGLLGLPEDIPTLIQYLEHPEFAENAATALQLMTGADLYEDVFVPEEIDPADLFPDELEKYERGEPLYPEGEEPGETINQVVRDSATWQQWYSEHKPSFSAGQRYRYGQVITAPVLLNALKAEKTPHRIRAFIVDELAIQFDTDVKINQNVFVDAQVQTIEQTIKTTEERNNRNSGI